jgi:cobalt ECF transporter T component CbiQ
MICRCSSGKAGKSFVEQMLNALTDAFDYAGTAEALAENGGLLQRLDPRVKVCGMLLLIFTAVGARNIAGTLAVFAVALALALASRVPLRLLAGRVWTSVLLFTGMIALPAIFLTPGKTVVRLPMLNWTVTDNGFLTALRLVARAETAATLALLLVLCTPWMQVLKALRVFRVPTVFVVILGMTHRYIFLLLYIARDLFEARRSRMITRLDASARRHIAVSCAGVLLGKSLQLSSDVFLAMQSRGFRGEVYTLDEFRMKPRDWCAAALFALAAAFAFWKGWR